MRWIGHLTMGRSNVQMWGMRQASIMFWTTAEPRGHKPSQHSRGESEAKGGAEWEQSARKQSIFIWKHPIHSAGIYSIPIMSDDCILNCCTKISPSSSSSNWIRWPIGRRAKSWRGNGSRYWANEEIEGIDNALGKRASSEWVWWHIVLFFVERRENEDGSLQKRASSDSVIKITPIAKRKEVSLGSLIKDAKRRLWHIWIQSRMGTRRLGGSHNHRHISWFTKWTHKPTILGNMPYLILVKRNIFDIISTVQKYLYYENDIKNIGH